MTRRNRFWKGRGAESIEHYQAKVRVAKNLFMITECEPGVEETLYWNGAPICAPDIALSTIDARFAIEIATRLEDHPVKQESLLRHDRVDFVIFLLIKRVTPHKVAEFKKLGMLVTNDEVALYKLMGEFNFTCAAKRIEAGIKYDPNEVKARLPILSKPRTLDLTFRTRGEMRRVLGGEEI